MRLSSVLTTGGAAVLAVLCVFTPLAWADTGLALPRHVLLGASAMDTEGGVKLIAVRSSSAADRAGLHVGDVVTSIAARPVANVSDFIAAVKVQPSGVPENFSLRRDGASIALSVVFDAAPNEHDPKVVTFYKAIPVEGSLRRTLVTTPANSPGRHPAILIVGGIGCYSIDVAADPQDPYLRIAHDIGARGFVVMRLEKSGVGDSQGPPCATVDFASEVNSYALALQALREDPDVDPSRVYLIGHSIGSPTISKLAEQQPVAGLIMLEGFGRDWFEYELWNLRRQLALGGDTPDVIDQKLAEKEVCMHRLLIAKESESEIEKTEPSCKIHNAYPVSVAYMQQVAKLNVIEPWTKVHVPVLAIYGTGDFVTALADHERVVEVVNAQHPGSATLRLIDGMDHHLDQAGTQQQAYDVRVVKHGSGPYESKLSATLLDWLCTKERCSKD